MALFALLVLAPAIGVECVVRFWIKPAGIGWQRSYQPFFESGGGHSIDARTLNRFSSLTESWEGPGVLGYRLDAGLGGLVPLYFYDPSGKVADPLERTDFLFQTELARYAPAYVDAPKGGRFRVFIIGGSVAVGSSATAPAKAWHALLERRLRQDVTSDIDVIPAAMGAWVSTQERLAFDLAVLPRDPDVVIVLDGSNDVAIAMSNGVRPGDPDIAGLRYAQRYRPSLLDWLTARSAALRWLQYAAFRAGAVRNAERLLRDGKAQDHLVEGIERNYRENLSHIVQVSRALGIECVVFLQPSLAVTDPVQRKPLSEAPLGQPYLDLWLRSFEGVRHALSTTPYADAVVDLSRSMVGNGRIDDLFTDGVHLTDRGHEILADAMYPRVEQAVRARLAASGRPTSTKPR